MISCEGEAKSREEQAARACLPRHECGNLIKN